MEKTNLENLNKLAKLFGTDRLISPEEIQEIRGVLVGVLANNKKEVESLTAETRELVNKVLNKVLDEHDTYLEKTKQIAQEAKSDTTEAIQATMKSLEEVKKLCKEVMDCKPENGKDADEEYVIGEVLNRIKLPEYKEVVLDDGGAIVDKINALPVNEENQIDAKHIKNLPEVKGGRVISGGVTRKIVEQMIEAAGGGGSQNLQQVLDTGNTATESGSGNTMELDHSGSGDTLVLNHSGSGNSLQVNGKAVVTGNLTVDTNTLYVDATNNVVGIGTTSPLTQTGNKLQVGDNSAANQYLVFQTNNTFERGIQYYLQDGTTLRGFLKWDGNEDLLYKGDEHWWSTGTVANHMVLNDTGLGLRTSAPTHTLTLASTSTGIALYNTADQTTNFERGEALWTGNEYVLRTLNGGTGTSRPIKVAARNSSGNQTSLALTRVSAPFSLLTHDSTGTTGKIHQVTGASAASSSTYNFYCIEPTINQATTAGYTALLVNPTETTTGSGSKLLADFQVGGVSKFNVANTGITTITNTNNAAASNQVLVLQGDRATPANNDEIYQSFLMSSSTGVQREFSRITAKGVDVTNASEDTRLLLSVMIAGTLTEKVRLEGSNWGPVANDGLALGSVAGSYSDLFLASGGVINWNNGNATLTHSTGLITSNVPIAAPQIYNADFAIAASGNAATVTRAYRNNVVTNNSAAGLTVTLSTTGAAAGDMLVVQTLPSSAVAQTITWVNTENSDVTPSANLNASTTSPRTDGFKWNPLTSKWRCVASC